MTFRRLLGLFPLVILIPAITPVVLAKTSQAPQICLAIGTSWIGTLEDRQRIDEVPVPEGFRYLLYKDVCSGRSLYKGGLIAWNLSFGTERTTTTALAFLREYYTKDLPQSDVRTALSKDWRETLQKPEKAKPKDDPPRVEAENLQFSEIAKSKDDPPPRAEPVKQPLKRRIFALYRMADNYAQVAKLYLWAAEFYESPALLEQALIHVAQSQAVTQFFQEEIAPRIDKRSRILKRYAALLLPGTSESDVSDNLTSDIALRAAVLKARLSRSPEDIDVAQARLDRHYVPVYRDAAEFANSNGSRRFCPHAANANREKVYAACDGGITNFGSGLRKFWLYQAQLDLLKAPIPWVYDRLSNKNRKGADDRSGSSFVKRAPGDTEVKTRLEVYNQIPSVRYARLLSGDRAMDIGLLYAEFYAKWSELPKYWARRRAYPESKARYLKLAMRELERLEQHVSAAMNPGRFRQIATRYLHYYDELTAIPESDLTPRDKLTAEPPNAFYYRTVLEALERIRTGNVSGPKKESP